MNCTTQKQDYLQFRPIFIKNTYNNNNNNNNDNDNNNNNVLCILTFHHKFMFSKAP
jgi:hypothetical protein